MLPLLAANLKEAVANLLRSKQRSFLALIGISVGIGSVISMISVGTVVKDESAKQFLRMGADILTIRNASEESPARRGRAATIGLPDALGLANIPSIRASAPYIYTSGQAVIPGKAPTRAYLVGVTSTFGELAKLDVDEGRLISDLDHRRYYTVIGSELATTMRAAGDDQTRGILGETIKLDDVVYTVVGVLQGGLKGPREFRMDRALLIPISTAQRVLGHSDIPRIIARANPKTHYLEAIAEVRNYFRRRSPDLSLRIESPKTLIEQMRKQMQLFTILLGAVGGISLLVGGIGIMNVMLISISERRLEIGVRRALGARQRDIQWQFLIESIILSLLGGAMGVALGIGAAYAICQFTNWTFVIPAMSIVLGVGVASAVGLFFGYYPAWQAARLDPIVALRGK